MSAQTEPFRFCKATDPSHQMFIDYDVELLEALYLDRKSVV